MLWSEEVRCVRVLLVDRHQSLSQESESVTEQVLSPPGAASESVWMVVIESDAPDAVGRLFDRDESRAGGAEQRVSGGRDLRELLTRHTERHRNG